VLYKKENIYKFQNGELLIHLDQGLMIRKTEHDELLETFMAVWPRVAGYGKLAVNSALQKSQEHMQAFDKLISYIWPGEEGTCTTVD
jgi:galactose-1-phosphate uridylyltransferase